MVFTQSCSRKLSLESSRYEPKPLVIDGAGDDWAKLPRFYDSENKLSYDVSNDDKNLYVILKAVDSELKSKILRGGFNIWLDTTWQRKQDRGIRFPLPATERTVQYGTTDKKVKGQQDTKEIHRKFAQNLQEMELVGMVGTKSARTTSQNPYGVTVAIAMDKEGTLFYEAAIPLNVIFHDSLTMPLVKRKVAIGLVSNKPEAAPTKTVEPNDGNDQFGKRGTGGVHGGDMMQTSNAPAGYSGRGGGGGGGMRHSGGGSYEAAEKNINLWMIVQLVEK